MIFAIPRRNRSRPVSRMEPGSSLCSAMTGTRVPAAAIEVHDLVYAFVKQDHPGILVDGELLLDQFLHRILPGLQVIQQFSPLGRIGHKSHGDCADLTLVSSRNIPAQAKKSLPADRESRWLEALTSSP